MSADKPDKPKDASEKPDSAYLTEEDLKNFLVMHADTLGATDDLGGLSNFSSDVTEHFRQLDSESTQILGSIANMHFSG